MDPVERAVARDEIRQLAARYALAVDSRDLDSLVGLFVPGDWPHTHTGKGTLPESWKTWQAFWTREKS